MKDPTTLPPACAPCFRGAGESGHAGRKHLRRLSSGLGVYLFLAGMCNSALNLVLVRIVEWSGYHGSLRFAATSYLDPVLYYLLLGTTFTVSFLVPSVLYMLASRMPLSRALPTERISADVWIAIFILGLGLSIMANVPSGWLSDLLESLFPSGTSVGTSSASAGGVITLPAVILALLRSTLLPALFEELTFRGILFGQLRRYGDGFAIIASALLFGLFHSNLSQIPFAFLVGVILAYILAKTNQIWIPIAIHFCNNLFAVGSETLRGFLSDDLFHLVYQCSYYGLFIAGALSALYLLWKKRDFFLPRFGPQMPMGVLSRFFAWLSAPGILLVILYSICRTFLF